MAAGLIRALVVCLGIVIPGIAQAQLADAPLVAGHPAPQLFFSQQDMLLAGLAASHPDLAAFYGANGLRPIFAGPDGHARREALIAAVSTAADHGLPPARYQPDLLRRLHGQAAGDPANEVAFARVFARWVHDLGGGIVDPRRIDPSIKREIIRPDTVALMHEFQRSATPATVLTRVAPQDPRYVQLQQALNAGDDLIAPADLPQVEPGLWRPGSSGVPVLHLRARLAAMGLDAGASGNPVYDAALAQAVTAYQTRTGLVADGIAGPRTVQMVNRRLAGGNRDILISLERMRWLAGHDLNARHVWVNLPEFNARILEGGRQVFETRAVIGKHGSEFRTPEFSDAIEYMVVNPRWNVPRSMAVRDYLPRLQANRHAVAHLDVIDANGNVVSRDRVDFNRYTAQNFPYRLRQKPSDDNAMGRVKFMFPNPWNIYLHDTPTRHLFDHSTRAYSSGCIRIGRPFDLAYELLRDSASDPQARFHRALDSGRETWLHLDNEIPVHLVYFTTFPDPDGTIRRYPDIYDRDAGVFAALERAALETPAPDA